MTGLAGGRIGNGKGIVDLAAAADVNAEAWVNWKAGAIQKANISKWHGRIPS
jgi:hypothetical protein